ncbi:hypothetical protein Tco_1145978 [Tanacetum coccineum]
MIPICTYSSRKIWRILYLQSQDHNGKQAQYAVILRRGPIRRIEALVCKDSGKISNVVPYSKNLQYADILIRASRLKKVMADKRKKSSMETFALNDKADYYFGITSITVNRKNAYDLKAKNSWMICTTMLLVEQTGRTHWREDGYYNGGNFPGAYHIGNSLHYQDLEWYEALEDSELKDEALRNKAIMEGLINDDESSNDYWKRWKSHEIYYHDYDEEEYENKNHKERHELCGIETREVTVCQIKRYKMIKYSFNNEEEYVAIKEDEYDDLTITSEEACRAYQEIFRMMDEGWMVTRTE